MKIPLNARAWILAGFTAQILAAQAAARNGAPRA